MAIEKDTVEYSDPTPFDGSKLQDMDTITKAIRHKQYGKDVREPIAQLGERLVKIIAETGGDPSAEVVNARGSFDLLGMREAAQETAIAKNQALTNQKFGKADAETYLKGVTAVPETFADLAAIKAKYPSGKNGLMVAADNGHKYIWANNVWTDAGVYQSVGIADGSINAEKLAGNAQTPIFMPSKDGIPNYDTNSAKFDFNCYTDQAYFWVSNKVITVPKSTVINNLINVQGSTSAKLIYTISNKTFSFVGWDGVLTSDQVMLGGLRRSKTGWSWSGSFTITIDGKQVDQYSIPPNTLFSPSSNRIPDFNSVTRVFDFASVQSTTATIVIGEHTIPVPEGTLAKPSDKAMIGNTLKVIFNVMNKTARVINWDENVDPYCLTIAFILMNHVDNPIISGGFPYTINGIDPTITRSNINFVTSTDGAPIYNAVNNTLDFNCYNDQAYLYNGGQSYRFPKNAKITVDQSLSGRSSFRFIIKLSTMEMNSIGWDVKVPFGWSELAAIRKTVNNEVLVTANFPITIVGASFKSYATVNAIDAKIKGICHRGFNIVAPEESKAAYLLAKQNGYHHWEGDINWTKDNVPMMIHDLAINRTARNIDGSTINVTTNLTDLLYSDLANYDFGIVKGERFKGEPLLTFEELVKLARYNDVFLHIEFKYEFTQEQVQMLHNIVVKYNMLDRIGWQAFGWDWLKPMMELEPNGQYELLGGSITDDYFTKMAALKTNTNTIIASQNAALSVEDIQKIADKGYPIYLWTVNDGATVRKFRDIGMVEGIMTDGSINVADELTRK